MKKSKNQTLQSLNDHQNIHNKFTATTKSINIKKRFKARETNPNGGNGVRFGAGFHAIHRVSRSGNAVADDQLYSHESQQGKKALVILTQKLTKCGTNVKMRN